MTGAREGKLRPLGYVPTNMAGIDNHMVCANLGGHLDHVVQLVLLQRRARLCPLTLLVGCWYRTGPLRKVIHKMLWINEVALAQIESAAHSSRRSCSEHPDSGVMNLKPGPPLDDVVKMKVFELRSDRPT